MGGTDCVESTKHNGSQCYIEERKWGERHWDGNKIEKKGRKKSLFKSLSHGVISDINFSLTYLEMLGKTELLGTENRADDDTSVVCGMSCCLSHAVSSRREILYLHLLQKGRAVKVSSCDSILCLIQDVTVLFQISRHWQLVSLNINFRYLGLSLGTIKVKKLRPLKLNNWLITHRTGNRCYIFLRSSWILPKVHIRRKWTINIFFSLVISQH